MAGLGELLVRAVVVMCEGLKIALWLHLWSVEVKGGQDVPRAKGAAVLVLAQQRGVWDRGERTRKQETGFRRQVGPKRD